MKKALATVIGIAILATASCAVYANSAVMPVQIWNGSPHDIFTTKLDRSIEEAFERSPAFVLSADVKDGSLQVTIPNVKRKNEGARTRITYSVEFATAQNKPLGSVSGSCWDDDLSSCANQILKGAVIAAKRIK